PKQPINLEYFVFIRAANNLISIPSSSNNKATGGPKDWEKVHQLKETVWETEILDWTWRQFQRAIFLFLEKDQTHLGVHLAKLEAGRLLKWKCIIFGHRVYGNKGNHIVSQDSDLNPFLEAVKESPTSKVTIKITMTDPSKSAKSRVQAKAQEDSLALSYGPDEEQLILERSHA
ncbi:hypothetical protein VP01_6664g2, partial [Puccinia sorghi]